MIIYIYIYIYISIIYEMIIAFFHLQMMSILYITYSNVYSPTNSSVSPSLETRPFTSAFTLGQGRGKVWGLLI